MIRDLLNPASGFLELREDGRGVVVAGISEVQAKKTSEVSTVLYLTLQMATCIQSHSTFTVTDCCYGPFGPAVSLTGLTLFSL